MATLLRLAKRFQKALDSARDGTSASQAAALEAGTALHDVALTAIQAGNLDVDDDGSFMAPIIMRTTLAASIVAYLERIPWAAVTPQMLRAPRDCMPLAAVDPGICVLALLVQCARVAGNDPRYDSPEPSTLLRQVRALRNWRTSN